MVLFKDAPISEMIGRLGHLRHLIVNLIISSSTLPGNYFKGAQNIFDSHMTACFSIHSMIIFLV